MRILRNRLSSYERIVRLKDLAAFNECARSGRLMETLEPWRDIHPAVVTLPMEWDYAVPYGVVHARQPSTAVARFVETLRSVAGG